jgi:hypothetical protein
MLLNKKQLNTIHALASEIGLDRPTRLKMMEDWYGLMSSKEFNIEQASKFISQLNGIADGSLILSFNESGRPLLHAKEI